MDTAVVVTQVAPTWVDVLNTASQWVIALLVPLALAQWSKWRGVQQTAQQTADQERAITTAVLSVQQDGIKLLKQNLPVPPGPDRLAVAVQRAKSLAPAALSETSDQEIELRVEANVAALALATPLSIRPPQLSGIPSIYPGPNHE